jgi:hypothetical protein
LSIVAIQYEQPETPFDTHIVQADLPLPAELPARSAIAHASSGVVQIDLP